MGKMPAGLARYWANKRRTGRRTVTKTRTVVKTARRYFGRRRRGNGKMKFPLMAIPVLASVAAAPLLSPAPRFGNQTAWSKIAVGDWAGAGGRALDAGATPTNYIPVVGTVILWGVARLLVGKRPIGKRLCLA